MKKTVQDILTGICGFGLVDIRIAKMGDEGFQSTVYCQRRKSER